MNTQLVGLDELIKTFRNVENLPQKCVSRSAKSGANIALIRARNKAPFLSGFLEKGIVLKAEKTKTKGKKVYQVTFSDSMSDVFVKTSKAGKRYYYPASQEYGFKTRNGGYVPGFHYMRDSVTSNSERIEKTIIDNIVSELDKIK